MDMDRDDYKKYFAIFELPQDASFEDVNDAYSKVKQAYAAELATTPNFEEDNEKIIEQLDDAYQRLAGLFAEDGQAGILEDLKKTERENNLGKDVDIEKNENASDDNVTSNENDRSLNAEDLPERNGDRHYSGKILRQIRENKGISLKEIALSSKIQAKTLECMENEEYETLPPRVYIKGFIVTYAKYLGLDQHKVSQDYMERYNAWRDDKMPAKHNNPFRRSKKR